MSVQVLNRIRFAALTVLVAFSCMVYELVLAQASSVVLGNALLNYSVTIGLYLAALGCGSFFYGRLKAKGASLLTAEVLLSYLGPLVPIFAVLAEYGLRRVMDPAGYEFHLALQLFMYVLIILIGVLSGLELPILMSLGESLCGLRSGAVLGLDYAGTLLAVAIFPTIGLSMLGLFGTAAMAGIGTWIAAALTIFALPRAECGRLQQWAMMPSFFIVLGILIYNDRLMDFMSHSVYLAGP